MDDRRRLTRHGQNTRLMPRGAFTPYHGEPHAAGQLPNGAPKPRLLVPFDGASNGRNRGTGFTPYQREAPPVKAGRNAEVFPPGSAPRPRVSTRGTGFTLLEVLLALTIVSIMAGMALPRYQRSVQMARSTEAVANLSAIRKGELLQQAEHGTYTEAANLEEINKKLGLDLEARHYDYEISPADQTKFLIIAKSLSDPMGSWVTMDHTGQLTYQWPTPGTGGAAQAGGGFGWTGPGVAGPPPGEGGHGGQSGGGSGGVGLGGGGGVGVAGSGGGGGGGGSGGSGGGGGAGPSAGGGSSGGGATGGGTGTVGGTETGTTAATTDGVIPGAGLGYLARGPDLWTNWPDTNAINITGTVGVAALTSAFNIVAASGAAPITDDLKRKGVSISFGAASDFDDGVIAQHTRPGGALPPATHQLHPVHRIQSGLRQRERHGPGGYPGA